MVMKGVVTQNKGSYTSKMEPKKASSIEHEKSQHKLANLEIEIHHGADGEISGHTVHHRFMPEKTKSPAFSSMPEHTSYVFDGHGNSESHGHLADHMAEHMPHVFGETTGGKSGMVSAENKPGQKDDDEEDVYNG